MKTIAEHDFTATNTSSRTPKKRRTSGLTRVRLLRDGKMSPNLKTKKAITFGLISCRDMLAKLEREIARLEAAKSLADACDHGTNAAVTAWHLVDWTWSAFEGTLEIHNRIAKDAGCPPPKFGKPQFTDWILGDLGCRSLRHCYIIATNSKHAGAESKAGDPDFGAKPGPVEVQWVNNSGQKITFVNSAAQPVQFTPGNAL